MIDNRFYVDLMTTSALYLCRAINTKAFRDTTKPMVHNFAQFKDDIRYNGYFHLNLKPWLFYCIKNKLSPKRSRNQMRHFDIKVGDFEVLRLLKATKQDTQFKPLLKYKALTLNKYKHLLADTLDKCEYYAKRFVNQKLVFLTQGSYLTKEDLVAELMMKAYDSLLLKYPCVDCKLHHENLCRTAIHNNGLNTLYFYNGKGRANMVNNGDGTFMLTSFNYQGLADDDTKDTNFFLDQQASTKDESDSGLTLAQLLGQHKGREKRFINILAGVYDKRFSRFLSDRKMIPNDELYDKLALDKYIDLACEHLDMTGYKAQTLITQLRNQVEGL